MLVTGRKKYEEFYFFPIETISKAATVCSNYYYQCNYHVSSMVPALRCNGMLQMNCDN